MSYLKTTDIVTKLRERTDYSTLLLCDPPRPAPDRLCHEAADEIERLREALTHYACDCKVNECEVSDESDTICGRTARAALAAPSKEGDDE
jgi:hypothetical protein